MGYKRKGALNIIEAGSLLPFDFYSVKFDQYKKRVGEKVLRNPSNEYLYNQAGFQSAEKEYFFGQEGLEFDLVNISEQPDILFSLLSLISEAPQKQSLNSIQEKIPEATILEWCSNHGIPEITHIYRPEMRLIYPDDILIDEYQIAEITKVKNLDSFFEFQIYLKSYYERQENIKNKAAITRQLQEYRHDTFNKFKSHFGGAPGFCIRDFRRTVEDLHFYYSLIDYFVVEDMKKLKERIPESIIYQAYDINHSHSTSYKSDEEFENVDIAKLLMNAARHIKKRELEAIDVVFDQVDLVDLKKALVYSINQKIKSKVILFYDEGNARFECRGVVGSYFDAAYLQLAQLYTFSNTDLIMHLKQCAMPGCFNLFWASHGNRKYCDKCDPKQAHRYAQQKYREKVKQKKQSDNTKKYNQ